MHRHAVTLLVSLAIVHQLPAQTFDQYLNPLLNKIEKQEGVKELKKLTPEEITDNDRVDGTVNAAFVVVRTNEGRMAKLLVQSARQKADDGKSIPILYVLRYVTYRIGTDQARIAAGEKLSLFPGFRFSLDLGQVVPKKLPADLQFVADGDKTHVAPVGKAKIYLLTKAIAAAKPKKTTKLVVGNKFEIGYFNGKYKLYDDGRRSGTLHLNVDEATKIVSGAYYSDRDGRKYEVRGRIANPQHRIEFRIKLPRAEQFFDGYLFTKNAKVIAGKSTLIKHETGFYAERIED